MSKREVYTLKRWIWLTVLLLIIPILGLAEGVPDHQRAELNYKDTTQANKSVVRIWTIKTALPEVDQELNGLIQAYVEEMSPDLPKAGNKTTKNSRLDADIRYSWTGDRWMSFVVQARTTYHRELTESRMTTRTYDMTTGQRIEMTDLFDPANDAAWDFLAYEVERQIRAYFPDQEPNEDVLAQWLTRDELQKADFSLHTMSMVLHYPASAVYQDRMTLLEVTLMYPEIWDLMTDEGFDQTDNRDKPMVAITYDDGPSRTPTTQLLNELRKQGVRATFFVIGNRIESYQDLVQREHDEGHAIGAHNYTHANVKNVSTSTLKTYRTKFDKALVAAIGIPSRYDRVPYGLYPRMIKMELGWPYIQWSLDTYDWRGRSPSAILSTVKKQVADGDIILCHDIKEKTQATAKSVINYLKDKGYMLATIDELFARDGVTLEAETVYFRCVDGDTTRK